MSEPIMEFRNTREAVDCMKEWQERLGLTDWTIKINLCEVSEMDLENSVGECECTACIKSARIQIMLKKYYGNRIRKYCAEKFLVHELLHCKLALLKDSDDIVANRLLHQTQEDLSYALIMAKYNLPKDFFDNITYEEEQTDEK
jgi:hypothetical protein